MLTKYQEFTTKITKDTKKRKIKREVLVAALGCAVVSESSASKVPFYVSLGVPKGHE
jgi:hypothetical protein